MRVTSSRPRKRALNYLSLGFEAAIGHSLNYLGFFRTIPLPQGVNADDANATFNNGVLEITMQASQLQSRGRRLEISEGGTREQTRGKAAGR